MLSECHQEYGISMDISKETKVLLHQTLVLCILLCNAATWKLKEEHTRKLQVFEMSVRRRILRITRRDRRRNIDVEKKLEIERERDITTVLQQRRLSYFGHVVRMEKERFPTSCYMVTLVASDDPTSARRLWGTWVPLLKADRFAMDKKNLKLRCELSAGANLVGIAQKLCLKYC